MNILYIHGFGSKFDPTSQKILELGKIGTVYGVDVDYTKPFSAVVSIILEAVQEQDIDILVGTSMGGYTVNRVGIMLDIPFVSINPALSPGVALRKYLGTHEDHYGREFTLEESALEEYVPFVLANNKEGLVLLDDHDDVIDSGLTQRYTRETYPTFMFPKGSHRFEHMEEGAALIAYHFGK